MVMATFHTSKSFVCLVFKTVDWSGLHSTLTTFGQVRIPHIWAVDYAFLAKFFSSNLFDNYHFSLLFGQVRIPHIKLGCGWQGRSQLSTKDPRSPRFSC